MTAFVSFVRIYLDSTGGSIHALMLAFGRGMGEFGATLMMAGNIPGKTQTLALAIYSAFQAGEDQCALFLSLLAAVICVLLLVGAELMLRGR